MTTDAAHDQFTALLEAHKKILYKITYAYCHDLDERNDLAQEIVVQLWRSFPRYDPQYRFSTWMYRIALNVAISSYRRQSVRERHAAPFNEALLEVAAPEGIDDNMQLLYQWIGELDALNKAMVLLYLDGHSHEAIADVLGISATNVATKMSRVKQGFRRRFQSVEHK